MDSLLTDQDRFLISSLTAELKRHNDREDRAFADALVSVNEAARLLHKSRQTISTMIAEHRLTKETREGVTGIPLRQLAK